MTDLMMFSSARRRGCPTCFSFSSPMGPPLIVPTSGAFDWLHNSRGALLVDWDNDGDQDLAVSVLGGVIVASNEGTRFEVRTFLPTRSDTMSLAAADYDIDGRLDLFVCAYVKRVKFGEEREALIPGFGQGFDYHDATIGERNSMFATRGADVYGCYRRGRAGGWQ